jgi:hypothetical protein
VRDVLGRRLLDKNHRREPEDQDVSESHHDTRGSIIVYALSGENEKGGNSATRHPPSRKVRSTSLPACHQPHGGNFSSTVFGST